MEIKKINDSYGVSGQITTEDVASLKADGIELLICNRPDGEAEGQPTFDEIAAAAKQQGIEVANIPFKGGQLTVEQTQAFNEQIGRGLKTHAYCRTGNRCTIIWEQGQQLLG